MGTITVEDPQGDTHVLNAVEGWPVMQIIRDHGLPIEAACGGACACATCQVIVDDSWVHKLYPARHDEQDKLDDAVADSRRARLSCQIIWSRELDGLRLRLAEV